MRSVPSVQRLEQCLRKVRALCPRGRGGQGKGAGRGAGLIPILVLQSPGGSAAFTVVSPAAGSPAGGCQVGSGGPWVPGEDGALRASGHVGHGLPVGAPHVLPPVHASPHLRETQAPQAAETDAGCVQGAGEGPGIRAALKP